MTPIDFAKIPDAAMLTALAAVASTFELDADESPPCTATSELETWSEWVSSRKGVTVDTLNEALKAVDCPVCVEHKRVKVIRLLKNALNICE